MRRPRRRARRRARRLGPFRYDGRTVRGPDAYLTERGDRLISVIRDGLDLESIVMHQAGVDAERAVLVRLFSDWAAWEAARL